jgi:ribosomal protein L24E
LLQAIHLLEKYPDKINWTYLSMNSNLLQATQLLETVLQHDINKLNWYELSENPNAIHILEKHPDKIMWCYLSKNPKAIHILEKYPEKINWAYLSTNIDKSYAIPLLEKNPKKINWFELSGNPSIFETDVKQTHIHIREKASRIDYVHL